MGAAGPFDGGPDGGGDAYAPPGAAPEGMFVPDTGGNRALEVLKADTSGLDRFVPKRKLRRVDHYSRMALLAAGRAMEGIVPERIAPDRTGLVVATGYGALNSTFSFLDSFIEKGDKLAAPTYFSGSVHNAAAAYISICYGITGPCLTVSQFDLSVVSALITAGTWLETEKVDAVLVGGVDEWCEVAGACMDKMAPEHSVCSLGEGASFFLVTREGDAGSCLGYFEDCSMGPGSEGIARGDEDIIFSPSATSFCRSGDIEQLSAGPGRVRVRQRGASPTDMGMDLRVALGESRGTGRRICCMKQGGDGMVAKVIVTGCR